MSLAATAVGLLGGGAAYVLVHLIGLLTNLALFHRFGWEVPSFADLDRSPQLVLTAMAGGFVVALLARWSPEIRGHGIPEAMEAVLTKESRIQPRTAVAKPISAAIAIGTGGPFGAEGPIIVTGGAIGSLLGQVLPMSPSERKILLASGAAAGMAATFGTPLAAVVLVIELLLFELSARAFVPLVVSSALAGGVHSAVFGSGPLFAVPPHHYNGLDKLPLYAVLGVVSGLVAVVVTRGLFLVEAGYRRLPVPDFWHPVVGALGFGLVGLVEPRALGVGYDAISDILVGRIAVGALLVLALAKLVAWWVALASGTSGGTLAPLLLISGAFGSLLGTGVDHLLPAAGVSPGAFALVAMAATFGASVRATFASIVFLFELTRDYEIILPLMLASVLAEAVAGALLRDSLMTEKLTRRGLRVQSDYEVDVLAGAFVHEVMAREVDALPVDATVGEARLRLDSGGHGAYPIVDGAGRCVGIIARQDLLQGNPGSDDLALDHASRDLVTVAPGDTLVVALGRLLEEDVGHLPVVADGVLVGMCTRTDILRARRRQLDDEQQQRGWLPTTGWRHDLRPPVADATGPEREGTDGMREYLVVANQTLGSEQLAEAIEERRAQGPCRFHVLVPATPPHDLYRQVVDALEGEVPDRAAARATAEARLQAELERLEGRGAAADGEVGPPDPLDAIREALAHATVDEIIVSTLPAPISRWLGMDLPTKVANAFDVPVVHVEARAEPAPEAQRPGDAAD
jgi:H+/Cl- antiporter ClcA